MELRPYQNDLIEETRNAYRSGFKRPCLVAPCGAGKSVIVADMARKATDKGNRVLFIVHRKELCEQIEETFSWWGVNMDLCQIAMVQTVTRRLKKTLTPQLIVTDENHHCVSNSYKRIYEQWPDVPCVGVTATPCRLNGGGLGEINDTLIVGPTVKELIAWGNLSPFRYYAPEIVDTSKLKIRAGEFKPEDVEAMFNNRAIWGDVIKHYQRLSNGKAICYCSSVKQSIEMADEFCKSGIPAGHIDGTTPKADRKRIINQFKSGIIKVICNMDLISEGFDVPDCQCAILLRPTQSLGLYIQQSMRCMRYQPGKTAVIIDHVGNVGRFGLPDAEREWTLDQKKKANGAEKNEVMIKECPKCFYVYSSELKACPQCGSVKEEKKEPEMIEAELVEVLGVKSFMVDYRKPEDCKNPAEMYALAKNSGFKPGWAYYQNKLRGWVK